MEQAAKSWLPRGGKWKRRKRGSNWVTGKEGTVREWVKSNVLGKAYLGSGQHLANMKDRKMENKHVSELVRTQRPTEPHIRSPGSVRGRMLGRKGTLSPYRDNYSSYLFNIASNRPSQDQLIDLATGLIFKEEKMMCLHPEVDSTLYRNKIMNVFVTFICSFLNILVFLKFI